MLGDDSAEAVEATGIVIIARNMAQSILITGRSDELDLDTGESLFEMFIKREIVKLLTPSPSLLLMQDKAHNQGQQAKKSRHQNLSVASDLSHKN